MVDENLLVGEKVVFRYIQPVDAEYVLSLRCDPRYNRFLSKINVNLDEQRRWIAHYKIREAKGEEFYFVIHRKDNGDRCGLVRIYDIKSNSFTWGSWILADNKPEKAALDSACCVYNIGFLGLGKEKAVFDVRIENEHTIKFHLRFGANLIGEDGLNKYFDLSRDTYLKLKNGFLSVLRQC